MNQLSLSRSQMRTVDSLYLTWGRRLSHSPKLDQSKMFRLKSRRLNFLMPKNKKSLTRKKQSLLRLNLLTLLLTLKTFQSSQLLMPLLLRKIWMLKNKRRNLKPHLKLINNLLSIKDILRNKPSSLPIKRHLQINKLANKLRKRPRPMILFLQKRESKLQQSQQ